MIKAIYFMFRKPGWAVEDFQDYWRTTHAALVRKVPGIRRYVQCHTLLSGYRRPSPPPADGIEEISFDAVKGVKVFETTDAGRSAVADFDNFADTDRIHRILTEEIIIKEGPVHEGMVKSIEFVARKPHMPLADFHRYWEKIHGPIAAKIHVISRYVQSHTLMGEYEKADLPVYDGLAETWFDDTGAMRISAATPEYVATRADEDNFLASELPVIITKEIKIV
jgi:uncharacterized protein (TIGR02118 family)